MRDSFSQYLGIIFTTCCYLLLSQSQIIAATEPQEAITIQQENNTNVYEVLIPTTNRNAQNAKSLIISLPSYLREGIEADDITSSCKDDEEKGLILCTNPNIPTELHFRWDTQTIMESRYCEEVTGDRQASQPWVGRYSFTRTESYPWTRSILINNLRVDDGSLTDTYADLTTKSEYAVLWSLGSSIGDRVEFGGNATRKPLLGTIESIQGNPVTLYIVDRRKHTVNISSAELTACSISDITTQTFDQIVEIEYFGEDTRERIDRVEYSPLRFTYNTVESTFSPTNTPTPTTTPLPTHTLTPTPTANIVIVNSATATPIPTSNSKSETLNSNNTMTETPTFTPTQIPNSPPEADQDKLEILNANKRDSDDTGNEEVIREQEGGEVLGASTETSVTESDNTVVSMLKWMGGLLTLGLLAFGIIRVILRVPTVSGSLTKGKNNKKESLHGACTEQGRSGRDDIKTIITILLFFGIWILGSYKVFAATPQLLVKITDPRSYYARSTNGSIDLITYPPNFYFAGAVAGGRVVLSSTPDGTGNVSLGNGGFLTRRLVNWSSSQNFGMNPPTNTGNCFAAQDLPPRELPLQYFNSPNTTYNVRATFQGYCPRSTPWQVSDLYLVYFPPEPTATPTMTPTPTYTPTPTPTIVPPFLDLPWDYESDDLTFTEAALRMTSYFDHEYPTVSIGGTFDETNMITFSSSYKDRVNHYSSHDGYDYANPSKVSYGDDQLAAAGGIASYHYDRFSGHAIFIDHGNSYQTRYYHMQPDGLIVSVPGTTAAVRAGQKIGRVGYSGNVSPAGLDGAHIHFMVIFDKNQDGDFQDNIPDGIVDPFGWQGEGADPWEILQFDYAGKTRTGMKSTYLWKQPISRTSTSVGPAGGEVKNEKVTLTIPQLVLPDFLQFFIRSAPRTNIDEHVESVGSIADITAVDGGGIAVKRFSQPINISFTYSEDDALYYDPDHMSVYSSPDGALWEKEQTLINHDMRTATATVDHLTLFALMGERRDTIAPLTTAILTGEGRGAHFHSDVTIELQPQDPCSENNNACHPEPVKGSTIDYTLFKLDDGEWEAHTKPVTVSTEGTHSLQYFSADKSGNVENVQTTEFTIDKTIPEIEMHYDLTSQDFIFSTDPDATIGETIEGVVIAEDTAGNDHEIQYEKVIADDLTSLEILGDSPGFYAISSEVHGKRGSAEDLQGRYEYFQSQDISIRKIPSIDGRLSVGSNGEISEDVATASLHIITSRDTLKIHD